MIITAVEMAGGLALLIIEAMIILVVLELGCRIFFKIREREGKVE